MPNNKEIKFSARLDDSQLNQDIQNFQRKLRELQDSQNRQAQGMRLNQTMVNQGLPAMGQYTQQGYQNAYNNNNNVARQAFAAEVEQLKKLEQVRESLTKKLERQTKIQEMMKEQGRDLLDIETRRANTAERLAKASQDVNSKLTVLNAGSGLLRPDMQQGPQYGPPAPPSGPPPPGAFSSVVGALGGASAIIAGIAKAVQIGTSVYRSMGEAPAVAAAAQGSAIQGTIGREVEAIYSGRSGIEAAFMPEKSKATAAAMEILRRRQSTTGLGIGAQIIGGTAAGAGIGAGVGSVIPGLGTMAGGIVGGATGFLGTAGSILSDKNSLYALMEAMGSKSAGQARQGLLAQEFAENFNKTRQGLIEQNPFKKAAAEQYNANAPAYLQFQRQLGLNYETFHGEGGFRGNATANGFTDEQAMSMSAQILGAGGSTGSAGGKNAVLALQAQRNFNLTNAGNILGKLSGVNANQQENKEALIRILAEGTKLGFDGSHYVEESRKFTETVAEIVSRGGGSSAEDAARAARSFAGFVSEPSTAKGLEAAKSMFERYQEMSSATTGARGVMRASGFLTEPSLRKLSQESRINLAGLSEQNLTAEHPFVTKAAREAGVTPEELIENITEVNRKAMTRRPIEKYRKELLDLQKKSGVTVTGENFRSIGGRTQELIENIAGGLGLDTGEMTGPQAISEAFKYVNNKPVDRNAAPSGKLGLKGYGSEIETKLLGSGPTGRVEDETVRANAEAADQMIKSFRSMKDELVPSAAAIHAFNEELRRTVDIISKMPNSANLLSTMFGKQVGATGGAQEQGGTTTGTGGK